jgi:hypothetical protein
MGVLEIVGLASVIDKLYRDDSASFQGNFPTVQPLCGALTIGRPKPVKPRSPTDLARECEPAQCVLATESKNCRINRLISFRRGSLAARHWSE